MQTLDSLLSDIQILAYDLNAAKEQNLQKNNPMAVLNDYGPIRPKRHIFSNWFMQQRRSANNGQPNKLGSSAGYDITNLRLNIEGDA